LAGKVAAEVERCIRAFSEQKKSEIVELDIQTEHVHLLILIPPKVSVSDIVGMLKGRTAMRVLNKLKELKKRPYWGNHFRARGYRVDMVGLDAEKILAYVKYQENQERETE